MRGRNAELVLLQHHLPRQAKTMKKDCAIKRWPVSRNTNVDNKILSKMYNSCSNDADFVKIF